MSRLRQKVTEWNEGAFGSDVGREGRKEREGTRREEDAEGGMGGKCTRVGNCIIYLIRVPAGELVANEPEF